MNSDKIDDRILYEHNAWNIYVNGMRDKLLAKFHEKICWKSTTEDEIFNYLYNEVMKLVVEFNAHQSDKISKELKLSILLNIGNYSMMLYDLIKKEENDRK